MPIPAPAAYQATDATAVLASQRKSSKKLIAAFCALLATILVAALAFIIPNFTAVKAMLGFRPTNPLVVTFDAINSLSTLRSTKYELRTHSSTDDSLDARMSGMYSLGKTTNESSASFTSKTTNMQRPSLGTKAHSPGNPFGMTTTPTTSTTRPTNMKMT
ncbi:MAG: hypothetical protein ACLUJX_06010 [Bifidobacterium longum]